MIQAALQKTTKRIPIGSRVRVADEMILARMLRGPEDRRPEPGQMLWAGRDASVAGYRRGSGNRSLYVLEGAEGLWPEEWIDPI
jgi:hypothetical protein